MNQTLLLDLKDADEHSIGSIFLKFAPFLKCCVSQSYGGQSKSSAGGEEKEQNGEEFCAAQRVSLEALIRPLQQSLICYATKELLKHTPASHGQIEHRKL